jgi:exosortase B
MSSAVVGDHAAALGQPRSPSLPTPQGLQGSAWPWVVALLGLVAMYAPSYARAWAGIWQTDEFGHAPLIACIVVWLLWRERATVFDVAIKSASWLGFGLFLAGALCYVAGRAMSIASAEFLSQWLMVGSVFAWLGGTKVWRHVWFAWLYLLFMVPLPASLVESLTGPLKHAISVLVVDGLYAVGYPIARSGVMITVGPYQLLVADACSGLNSMFSLAALGTLFTHLVARGRSTLHTVVLVAAIVPIAFVANVLRVVTLVMVTYHLGDEAGQGFLHGAAGMVLMVAALFFFMALDRLLTWFLPRQASVALPAA